MNIEKFKTKAKELKSTVSKELEEATLDAAGLRRLIYIKNQELKHMKALAATILSQRTETEQFFLEALNEVKEVIKSERKSKVGMSALPNPTATKGKGNSSSNTGTTFPPLNIKPANMHLMESRRKQPDFSIADLDNVTISDLGWEDKELVLRVLFAKMNGQGQNTANSALARQRNALGDSAVPQPVFISEGVQMAGGDQINLQHFQIHDGDDDDNESHAQNSAISSLDGDR